MFVKPVKGRSVPDPARGDLLPAATFCPPKGEMLTRTTTGCAVKQRVISGA